MFTPEELAKLFHETYERLAPLHGYETRKDSAVPWSQVPERNKSLMIAVCSEVLERIQQLAVGAPTQLACEAIPRDTVSITTNVGFPPPAGIRVTTQDLVGVGPHELVSTEYVGTDLDLLEDAPNGE